MRYIRLSVLVFFCGLLGSLLAAEQLALTPTPVVSQQASGRTLPLPIDLGKLKQSAPSGLTFGSTTMRIMQDVALDATLAQVMGSPDNSFSPFNPAQTYALNFEKAFWLHFRVTTQADIQDHWSFELTKPFIDRVEFYYRDPQGTWKMQVAGDHIPQQQWAVRGLTPQFYLPSLSPGTNDFYVKVHQLLPLRITATLKTIEQATFNNQNALFFNGLLLGLFALMSLFSLVLSLTYRNTVYVWYALFLVLVLLGLASYVGVGHYMFWPSSGWWPQGSSLIFVILALAVKLQFGRTMFVNARSSPWLNRLAACVTLMTFLGAVTIVFTPFEKIGLRQSIALVFIGSTMLLTFFIVIKAAIKRSQTALLWCLAYLPVVACFVLTWIEQWGVMALSWLPYNAIGFAVAAEAIVLLAALHLYVKTEHARLVRTNTLADLDPLTGFIAAPHYAEALSQLWSHARFSRQDLAIAYVRATVEPDTHSSASQITSDEVVLRCVRMLRIIARPDDTVARIGKNMYAVLMSGVSAGPGLSNRLSRLIALGAMREVDEVTHLPIRFRIVTSTFKSYSGTSSRLDAVLRQKLDELSLSPNQSIMFVTS